MFRRANADAVECYKTSVKYKRYNAARGFSLFELVVVLVIVAILSVIALNKFRPPVEDSQKTVFIFQAKTFSRLIENVHAVGVVKNSKEVTVSDGVVIFLNDFGWPVASSSAVGASKINASAQGCKSLWLDLFSNVQSVNGGGQVLTDQGFTVLRQSEYICRYIFTRKEEGSFFFDYDIRTGRILMDLAQ